ncbi:MAG: FAD-dependent oxidoreductase [Actinobacteria bacterium]|nr:FAD-dependent oxidoreductase [Actinomycetota bacterium]
MNDDGVLIVGGGLAAQRASETLRRRGYEGPVRMVCAEPLPPYDRPPLSKKVLAGEVGEETLAFRPRDWYRDHEVELVLGDRAASLDPLAHRVRLESGARFPYRRLLIATGGAPRRLPFLGHPNVHVLRDAADARRLRAALVPGVRLAIVGAGFIGQEVAATARGLGARVTLIEALPAPLAPILGEELGGWFAGLHREEGIEVRLGAALAGARGGDAVEELILADGERIGCDQVLVGIGTVPATAWLAEHGFGDGVPVDMAGRTALEDVYAAGDAALSFDPVSGTHHRTEHWEAAAWEGAAVAKAMLGEEPGRPPLASFWSDQYGLRVQCVGDPRGADATRLDGDPAARDFEVLFTRAGVPVAGLAVGRPAAIRGFRDAIQGGAPVAARKELTV